jgi:hypothetical protein
MAVRHEFANGLSQVPLSPTQSRGRGCKVRNPISLTPRARTRAAAREAGHVDADRDRCRRVSDGSLAPSRRSYTNPRRVTTVARRWDRRESVARSAECRRYRSLRLSRRDAHAAPIISSSAHAGSGIGAAERSKPRSSAFSWMIANPDPCSWCWNACAPPCGANPSNAPVIVNGRRNASRRAESAPSTPAGTPDSPSKCTRDTSCWTWGRSHLRRRR